MRDFIQKVSLPNKWAENMLAELDKEKEQAKLESLSFVQNLQNQKSEVEQKIENLLDLYIEGKGLAIEEYQAKKQKLLNEKLDIEQKIRDFEQMGNNWLEPMRKMIFEAKQAKILLSQGDNQQILTFLKNVGSNFILKDKKFNFAPKIGWRALAESEPNFAFTNWRWVQDSNLCRENPPTFEVGAIATMRTHQNISCAPGETRTHNRHVRNVMLYPIKLRVQKKILLWQFS